MATEDDFRPRLGKLRARGSPRGRRYLQHVLRAVARAGGNLQRRAAGRRRGFTGSRAGRGAAISHALAARDRYAGYRQRRVVIKSRIVKLAGKGLVATKAHLRYIQRDGVTPAGDPGQLYDASVDHADGKAFLARCEGDRHQFRFIVAAEDAAEYPDLKPFIRKLMARTEEDLGTGLEWVAVDHHNTGHPHTHVLLRGKDDQGKDLVIARDYISRGMRERVTEIVTLDLGPQSDLEVERKLRQEVDQERFTSLDRSLLREAGPDHVLTIRSGGSDLSKHAMKMGRVRKLQQLGLASEVEPGRWNLAKDLEDQLRALGTRGDIIKTLNRELRAMGVERSLSDYAVADADGVPLLPVVGRVLRKGLADELNDRRYVIVDGVDGRVHYVDIGKGDLPDPMPERAIVSTRPRSSGVRRSDRTVLEIASANGGQYSVDIHLRHDATATAEFAEAHVRRLEAIRRIAGGVERRPDGTWLIGADHLDRVAEYEQARTRTAPVVIQVLSAWSLEQQVSGDGATWLDRELVSGAPTPLRDAGFGREVRRASDARRQWLIQEELAHEEGGRIIYRSNLLTILRRRELARVAAQLSEELGLKYVELREGQEISGIYHRRVDLPSGKFAVVRMGTEYCLAPWKPTLERKVGASISGTVKGDDISWTIERQRNLIVS
jgi:type IV secretory pathway VirD2 relaxase